MALEFSKQFLSGETQNAEAALEQAIVYSPETYGSIESFLSDNNKEDFETFKNQFLDAIDGVARFAEKHVKAKANKSGGPSLPPSAAKSITTRLEKFKKNLFGQPDYYGKHKDIIYSTGKTAFFTFSELLHDEGLPLDKRLTALKILEKATLASPKNTITILEAAVVELNFPASVYSREKHKSLERFLKHGDFEAFRKEFKAEIDRLIKFADEHIRKESDAPAAGRLSSEAAGKIRGDLEKFKANIFSRTHFPPQDKELIYSEGKRMFFNYGRLLHSGKAPLDTSLLSLQNVAEKMVVCSGGMVTELQDEADNLTAFIQPYDGKVRNLIQTFARQIIVEFVQNRHGNDRAMEVHYVNRYFNHAARRVGCVPRDVFRGSTIAISKILPASPTSG
jgi:hypothetical protein